ncbi:Vms1/Ankzf1 family peptidyl-tRNA hydrolase [Streptomyces gobiensis]|uniref:baeRF2 domain-containing protein n=1 Tax=Streptomyces gobiensis TaxID=2875706 RepID=UPI001E4E0CB9|nr:Vms1/Ankzf1 family peptidyl-tRNA hydrolase [Streptomyces gobiensis]UGY94383.1 hypothetical protein test1122_23370 [Streptomyces gobiensis]
MELGFLNPLYDRPGPWASVYFDTTTTSEDAPAQQELSARAACDRLAQQGADEPTCRAVYDTLSALPRTSQPPGRAVFATHGEVVLDPALTTPPPGGGPYTCWAPLPHTGPLLDFGEAEPSCLIAHIDRTGADFEIRGPLGTHSAGRVDGDDWPVHRTPTTDWSERRFQNAVENTWDRNAAVIAEALLACQKETGATLVVLTGEHRQCLTVRDNLPPETRDAVVEAERSGRLDDEVEAARAAHIHRNTAQVMDRFLAGRVPTEEGQVDAVEGVPALVGAAREHRIAALLVRPDGPDLYREVWVGDEPDQIAVRRTEAHYLGELHPVSARADDALLRSAATTGAEVISVRPHAEEPELPTGLPVGGLGALLRWPYEGGAPPGGGARPHESIRW